MKDVFVVVAYFSYIICLERLLMKRLGVRFTSVSADARPQQMTSRPEVTDCW